MNRLLINMQNKRSVLKTAINQLITMKKGETITVNGLTKLSFDRGNLTDKQIDEKINKLRSEEQDLFERCDRMLPYGEKE